MSEDQEIGNGTNEGSPKNRRRLSQNEIPSHTVEEALRVPLALADNYGKQATKPLGVAAAMGFAPTTGKFRTITGASIAYGFTEGGYNASAIGLTDLGRRAVAPTEDGDDLRAMREGFLHPRVIGEFMRRYDGSPLPRAEIGRNVLETLGVPPTSCDRAWNLIVEGADFLGLLTDIEGQKYVDLERIPDGDRNGKGEQTPPIDPTPEAVVPKPQSDAGEGEVVSLPTPSERPTEDPGERRIFITHGKKRKIASQLKEILAFGEFEPVVSVERETTAKPVPKKVLDDMRACGAAIIHVNAEQKVLTQDGGEEVMLNANVLIEIGAAMALYQERFILLVEEGVELPSNLQGLYEVRYSGETLDQPATMKLLKALREFKDVDKREAA